MNVKVSLIITVDREAWSAEYGSDESADEIRHNIKYTAQEAVEIAFAHLIPDVLTVRDSNL